MVDYNFHESSLLDACSLGELEGRLEQEERLIEEKQNLLSEYKNEKQTLLQERKTLMKRLKRLYKEYRKSHLPLFQRLEEQQKYAVVFELFNTTTTNSSNATGGSSTTLSTSSSIISSTTRGGSTSTSANQAATQEVTHVDAAPPGANLQHATGTSKAGTANSRAFVDLQHAAPSGGSLRDDELQYHVLPLLTGTSSKSSSSTSLAPSLANNNYSAPAAQRQNRNSSGPPTSSRSKSDLRKQLSEQLKEMVTGSVAEEDEEAVRNQINNADDIPVQHAVHSRIVGEEVECLQASTSGVGRSEKNHEKDLYPGLGTTTVPRRAADESVPTSDKGLAVLEAGGADSSSTKTSINLQLQSVKSGERRFSQDDSVASSASPRWNYGTTPAIKSSCSSVGGLGLQQAGPSSPLKNHPQEQAAEEGQQDVVEHDAPAQQALQLIDEHEIKNRTNTNMQESPRAGVKNTEDPQVVVTSSRGGGPRQEKQPQITTSTKMLHLRRSSVQEKWGFTYDREMFHKGERWITKLVPNSPSWIYKNDIPPNSKILTVNGCAKNEGIKGELANALDIKVEILITRTPAPETTTRTLLPPPAAAAGEDQKVEPHLEVIDFGSSSVSMSKLQQTTALQVLQQQITSAEETTTKSTVNQDQINGDDSPVDAPVTANAGVLLVPPSDVGENEDRFTNISPASSKLDRLEQEQSAAARVDFEGGAGAREDEVLVAQRDEEDHPHLLQGGGDSTSKIMLEQQEAREGKRQHEAASNLQPVLDVLASAALEEEKRPTSAVVQQEMLRGAKTQHGSKNADTVPPATLLSPNVTTSPPATEVGKIVTEIHKPNYHANHLKDANATSSSSSSSSTFAAPPYKSKSPARGSPVMLASRSPNRSSVGLANLATWATAGSTSAVSLLEDIDLANNSETAGSSSAEVENYQKLLPEDYLQFHPPRSDSAMEVQNHAGPRQKSVLPIDRSRYVAPSPGDHHDAQSSPLNDVRSKESLLPIEADMKIGKKGGEEPPGKKTISTSEAEITKTYKVNFKRRKNKTMSFDSFKKQLYGGDERQLEAIKSGGAVVAPPARPTSTTTSSTAEAATDTAQSALFSNYKQRGKGQGQGPQAGRSSLILHDDQELRHEQMSTSTRGQEEEDAATSSTRAGGGPPLFLPEPEVEILQKPLDPYEEKRRMAEKFASNIRVTTSTPTPSSTSSSSFRPPQAPRAYATARSSTGASRSFFEEDEGAGTVVERDHGGEERELPRFLQAMNRIDEILSNETTKHDDLGADLRFSHHNSASSVVSSVLNPFDDQDLDKLPMTFTSTSATLGDASGSKPRNSTKQFLGDYGSDAYFAGDSKFPNIITSLSSTTPFPASSAASPALQLAPLKNDPVAVEIEYGVRLVPEKSKTTTDVEGRNYIKRSSRQEKEDGDGGAEDFDGNKNNKRMLENKPTSSRRYGGAEQDITTHYTMEQEHPGSTTTQGHLQGAQSEISSKKSVGTHNQDSTLHTETEAAGGVVQLTSSNGAGAPDHHPEDAEMNADIASNGQVRLNGCQQDVEEAVEQTSEEQEIRTRTRRNASNDNTSTLKSATIPKKQEEETPLDVDDVDQSSRSVEHVLVLGGEKDDKKEHRSRDDHFLSRLNVGDYQDASTTTQLRAPANDFSGGRKNMAVISRGNDRDDEEEEEDIVIARPESAATEIFQHQSSGSSPPPTCSPTPVNNGSIPPGNSRMLRPQDEASSDDEGGRFDGRDRNHYRGSTSTFGTNDNPFA
ncbi:unnamed protein product [Amoebophrya sp. A120]|nr:unnamed protein product [Amoebophrya sp. A120]|eukprot:GSA120T00008742001.1